MQFDAIYQNGVFLPKQPVSLPNGTEVRVAIETRDGVDDPLAAVIGICDGPADAADAHDEYIYGNREA
jgi:predicted DNA-binding antitoxin AbrB/MazE fold protein